MVLNKGRPYIAFYNNFVVTCPFLERVHIHRGKSSALWSETSTKTTFSYLVLKNILHVWFQWSSFFKYTNMNISNKSKNYFLHCICKKMTYLNIGWRTRMAWQESPQLILSLIGGTTTSKTDFPPLANCSRMTEKCWQEPPRIIWSRPCDCDQFPQSEYGLGPQL